MQGGEQPEDPAWIRWVGRGSWRAWLLVRALSMRKVRLRSERDIARLRGIAARLDRLMRVPSTARVREETRAPVSAEWIEVPESSPRRVLLYLPGSAFVTHTARLHRSLAARICERAGATAFMPAYRLAPERARVRTGCPTRR